MQGEHKGTCFTQQTIIIALAPRLSTDNHSRTRDCTKKYFKIIQPNCTSKGRLNPLLGYIRMYRSYTPFDMNFT